MEYKILYADDIEAYKEDMIALMEMVLKDNISQNYLLNRGEINVNKIYSYIMESSVIILDAFKEGV